jgi:hypothetical protein
MDNILDKLALLNSPEYEAARRTLEFFYEALSVLDHKAEALMVFDGILIAASAFVLDRGNLHRIHKWRRTLVLLAIMLALFAAASCLFVARVKYSFLGDMTICRRKAANKRRVPSAGRRIGAPDFRLRTCVVSLGQRRLPLHFGRGQRFLCSDSDRRRRQD